MPSAMAWTSMKLIGMNRPMKKRKEERVRRTKRMSVNGSRKTLKCNGRGLGGSLDLTVRVAIPKRPSSIKAITRIVHPNPI